MSFDTAFIFGDFSCVEMTEGESVRLFDAAICLGRRRSVPTALDDGCAISDI